MARGRKSEAKEPRREAEEEYSKASIQPEPLPATARVSAFVSKDVRLDISYSAAEDLYLIGDPLDYVAVYAPDFDRALQEARAHPVR